MIRAGLVVLVALVVLALAGCDALKGAVPTLQYCQYVQYKRDGDKVDITAECRVPIGGGGGGLLH